MVRTTGAIGKALLKWVLIPIVLAVVGYFFVGPSVAAKYMASKPTPEVVIPVAEEVEPVRSKSTSEPKVEISSQRVRSRSTTRRKPPTSDQTRPESTEPPPSESPEPASPTGTDQNPTDGIP